MKCLFDFAEQRMRAIQVAFEQGGFPGVVGLIDGTHISIRAPIEEPDAYINRKKFHSLNVQVICDENMVFIDILAGWPGSVHDSRILRNSTVYITRLPTSFQVIHICWVMEDIHYRLGS